MKCDKKTMRLYAVTDRTYAKDNNLFEPVKAALCGGVTCVQLREKDLCEKEFLYEAKKLCALCKSYGVPFIINDNAKVAIKSGADGIHVGQSDMPAAQLRKIVGDDMIIGVSVHSLEEAQKAEKDGADYLGVGAMFKTESKADADNVSFETLKNICQNVSLPVVCIGGINAFNISLLGDCGADGAAMISAIFSAQDIKSECKKLRKLSEEVFGI